MRNVLLYMLHFSFSKSLSSFRVTKKTLSLQKQLSNSSWYHKVKQSRYWSSLFVTLEYYPMTFCFTDFCRDTQFFVFFFWRSWLSSDLIWDSELALVCFKICSEGDHSDEASHFKCFMKIFGEVNERYKRLHCVELIWFHFRTVLTWN